jgi:hypothetical protein
MIYIFDTTCFCVIQQYFPCFTNFWIKFNDSVSKGIILSVREVLNELQNMIYRPHMQEWLKNHKHIFLKPTSEETEFLTRIFFIKHFRQLVKHKNILEGKPSADPFVIAAAKIKNACVVTEEEFKKNAAKIPNVCQYFKIECTNLEGFMKREKWQI